LQQQTTNGTVIKTGKVQKHIFTPSSLWIHHIRRAQNSIAYLLAKRSQSSGELRKLSKLCRNNSERDRKSLKQTGDISS